MGRAFEYRKGAKLKRWGKMSKIFPKLGKAIQMAAKEGGSDPNMNPKLRLAIQNAKAENMPKDNIEKAIKRAEGKDSASFVEVHFEGKGPHGVQCFVECATDNNTRTAANMKSYFNKSGGELLQNGALEYMFNRKAVIEFEITEGMDIEEVELELIDAGLEEVEEHDGTCYVTGDYKDFHQLNEALIKLGIEPQKAVLEQVPTTTKEFTDEQMQDIEKLIDKIEDDDDVQAVYTTIG